MGHAEYKLEHEALTYLRLFGPDTHSLEIRPGPLREYMISKGWIEWVPPILGSNHQYSITEKGERAVREDQMEEELYHKDRGT